MKNQVKPVLVQLIIIMFMVIGCVNEGTEDITPLPGINPGGSSAFYPVVKMDNMGNAIIVWTQYDESSDIQIFRSEYRNGSWTHPSSLSDHISLNDITHDADYFDFAMDNNGNAIIVWHQFVAYPDVGVFMSEYRNGAWTHPSSLSDNISPGVYPKVAMDDNGNAIIVWNQSEGVFKSEYRNGSWTYPSSLSDHISPDGSDTAYPVVAMDNTGNAIIAWNQKDGSSKYQIFKSEYRNGSWTHPSSLSDNISPDGTDTDKYSSIKILMDDNGNAIIAWNQKDGSSYNQIFKSEYRNSTWTHPASQSDNISPDGSNSYNFDAAMDNNGNAIIVWTQSNHDHSLIYKSEYRNGTWTYPLSLNDYIGPRSETWNINVAMDNNGNAIIVSEQSDKREDNQIFKSTYYNGLWTYPSSLSDNISPDKIMASSPVVAMDDNGNTIIVWDQTIETDDYSIASIVKREYR